MSGVSGGRLPNFFVVGAPKAGTTSVWRYLDQHPDVFMSPIKEPSFFAPEMVEVSDDTRARHARERRDIQAFLDGPMTDRRHQGFVVEWEAYRRLFRNARDERAIGEGTVAYHGSLAAPQAIRQRIPDARIVMILRDPAERLFAHYKAVRAMRRTSLGYAAWADEQRRLEASRSGVPWGSFWAGRYGDHVARYLSWFPAERVHIVFYDDLAADAPLVMRQMFAFLGVDPGAPVDTSVRHNETVVPRWQTLDRAWLRTAWRSLKRALPRGAMAPARHFLDGVTQIACRPDDRARVIAMYDSDVRALERTIGRDLSRWRTP
jgi:hypothetical protein